MGTMWKSVRWSRMLMPRPKKQIIDFFWCSMNRYWLTTLIISSSSSSSSLSYCYPTNSKSILLKQILRFCKVENVKLHFPKSTNNFMRTTLSYYSHRRLVSSQLEIVGRWCAYSLQWKAPEWVENFKAVSVYAQLTVCAFQREYYSLLPNKNIHNTWPATYQSNVFFW